MKILFSNPPWWEVAPDGHLRQGIRAGSRWPFTQRAHYRPDEFRFGAYIPFPFFLAHAASYTQAQIPGAEVTLRDSVARGESYGTFFAAVREMMPEWIVIETATPSWTHDADLLRQLHSLFPEVRVILAGPLDCSHHQSIFAGHPNVSAIVQGEYDKQVARAIVDLQVSGLRSQVFGHSLLTVSEMDASPPPMFDEACALHYADGCPILPIHAKVPTPAQTERAARYSPPGASGPFPHLQLWTSRGCPFKCIFCVWPAVMTGHDPDGTRPRAVRSYSPEWLDRFLTDRLERARAAGQPYRSIYLDDDTYNLTKRHVAATAPVLARTGLPWSAMCRADTLDDDHWRLMRDSGCFGVKIGFESGSQHVIDHIVNKRLDLAAAADRARWLRHELGLTVHGTFTIGLPGETQAQEQETLDFISMLYATNALDTHQLSGTSTIEGTPLHTLTQSGPLAKYDAARIDDRFIQTADGQAKIEQMQRHTP